MQDAISNSNNKASVPVPTTDNSISFLITARCEGAKIGERCDFHVDPDCFGVDVCPGLNITKAEIHHCDCLGAAE
ncbi:hypothetical protein KAR91_44310 [Candidatus Pacearchaeota archaeon]|nr:hypothetical protein [Candidatus Pacearchaeota archaeon]